MAIRTVELFHVALPLKTRVKHASHDRMLSDSLVVRVTLEGGAQGYGEGVPRPYVTGETIESTFATLSAFDVSRHMGRPADFTGVLRRLDALEFPETREDPRGMAGNSARCALELALLDAYGRQFERSVGDAVRLSETRGLEFSARPTRVRYSGAITASSEAREQYSAWKLWLYGFAQIKLKVGVDGQDDPARLRTLRRIVGRSTDLRLDANEAWPVGEVVERARDLLPYGPSVLEQPVPHAELDGLTEIRPRVGIPLMLDESLCGYPDAVRAVETRSADLLNVRLSKCGGILPSLSIVGLALRSGLGVHLGCHPGETGLLSAAGRHVASNLRRLAYVEGSYDRHILVQNLTRDDPTFGYGGWAPPLNGPGLGVRVDLEALDRLTVTRAEVCHD